MSEGRLTSVHHFDSKATVEAYIRTLPITSAFFMPACYMQNMQTVFRPQVVRLTTSYLLHSSMVVPFFGSLVSKTLSLRQEFSCILGQQRRA